MLDERKKRVLKAIIEEYVNTAEPVSSAALVKNHNLDFSSATLRNDMAELENIGFLDKPHTSSGRVPSAKGYRFYVDKLLKNDFISLEEIQYIKEKLKSKEKEIENITRLMSVALSELTNYTAISIEPDLNKQIISDIKFVLLGTNILLAVILTDTGLIKETIIKLDENITSEQTEMLNKIFNISLKGLALNKIDNNLEKIILEEMKNKLNLIKQIVKELNKFIEENINIYLEGTNKVFDFPEFNKVDNAKKFLDSLDEKEYMVKILNNDIDNINVYIGEENLNDKLKNCSIITFKNIVDGKDLGTIGIIGPTRMNYSKVISIMKYIKENFNKS